MTMSDDDAFDHRLLKQAEAYARLYPSILPRLKAAFESGDPAVRELARAMRVAIDRAEGQRERRLRDAWGLSPQEVRVALQLIDGGTVATCAATMEVAEMVLSGAINKEIANWITLAGREADVRGVGLSGKDARLITVEKATRTKKDPTSRMEEVIDLGFVGEPTHVDPQILQALIYAEQRQQYPAHAG